MDESLTVKTVSLLSGVSPHTLRAWERRYKAILPKRTKTGRRVYCLADVEKLKLLNCLVEGGYAIGGIARMSTKELDELVRKLPPSLGVGAVELKSGSVYEPDFAPNIRAMVSALTDYKLDLLDHEMMRARATFTIRTLILQIFGALMTEVGNLVASEKLGIAQEHALSALVRGHLGQIFQSLSTKSARPVRAILSTPEGDLHEFGILMSAILCASHGISVHYLGPNLPPEDLASAAVGTQAHLIILGCTPLPVGTTAINLKGYLKRLVAPLQAGVEVWVGGDCPFDLGKNYYSRTVRHIATLSMLDELLARFNNGLETLGVKS